VATGIVHRYNTIEEQRILLKKSTHALTHEVAIRPKVGAAVGVTGDLYRKGTSAGICWRKLYLR
jgi:hypothetical protein